MMHAVSAAEPLRDIERFVALLMSRPNAIDATKGAADADVDAANFAIQRFDQLTR
jgi:hypothetical protein